MIFLLLFIFVCLLDNNARNKTRFIIQKPEKSFRLSSTFVYSVLSDVQTSNSLLSEQLCLILRANKKVKVSNEIWTFAKIVNPQYNSLISLLGREMEKFSFMDKIGPRKNNHCTSIFMFESSLEIHS
jgi:hypothetical protein